VAGRSKMSGAERRESSLEEQERTAWGSQPGTVDRGVPSPPGDRRGTIGSRERDERRCVAWSFDRESRLDSICVESSLSLVSVVW